MADDTDRSTGGTDSESTDEHDVHGWSRTRIGLTALRLSAFVLVIGGFAGAVSRDVSPVAGDSAFSLAFFAGIACAVASIYLGIFLQE